MAIERGESSFNQQRAHQHLALRQIALEEEVHKLFGQSGPLGDLQGHFGELDDCVVGEVHEGLADVLAQEQVGPVDALAAEPDLGLVFLLAGQVEERLGEQVADQELVAEGHRRFCL